MVYIQSAKTRIRSYGYGYGRKCSNMVLHSLFFVCTVWANPKYNLCVLFDTGWHKCTNSRSPPLFFFLGLARLFCRGPAHVWALWGTGVYRTQLCVLESLSKIWAKDFLKIFCHAQFWVLQGLKIFKLMVRTKIDQCFLNVPGLFSSFFGSKGFIKFVKVLEPSNCLKSTMCNFGKPATFKSSQSVVYVNKIL